MGDEHPRNKKLAYNQCRQFLESISSPTSRRSGGLAAAHDLGKHHEAAGCPRCETNLTSSLKLPIDNQDKV
jgi:hypothetical protein